MLVFALQTLLNECLYSSVDYFHLYSMPGWNLLEKQNVCLGIPCFPYPVVCWGVNVHFVGNLKYFLKWPLRDFHCRMEQEKDCQCSCSGPGQNSQKSVQKGSCLGSGRLDNFWLNDIKLIDFSKQLRECTMFSWNVEISLTGYCFTGMFCMFVIRLKTCS